VTRAFLSQSFDGDENLDSIPNAGNTSLFECTLVEIENHVPTNIMLTKPGSMLRDLSVVKPPRYMYVSPLFDEFQVGKAWRTFK
jgi:hypothetical protein